jgi:dihydropteroate synthase
MQGMPQTMQTNPSYVDVVAEIAEFLRVRAQTAVDAGIDPAAIVVDPGIGFGKNLEHNLILLRNLPVLGALGFPVLVGVSRKTFIGRILAAGPEDRLEGSLAAACIAILGGARIIRVHDVQQTVRAVRIVDAVLAADSSQGNAIA